MKELLKSKNCSTKMSGVLVNYIDTTNTLTMNEYIQNTVYKSLESDLNFKKYFSEHMFDVKKYMDELYKINSIELILTLFIDKNSIRENLARYWFPELSVPEIKRLSKLLTIVISNCEIDRLRDFSKKKIASYLD